MDAKLIKIKCPACGADLQIEKNRKEFYCTYCGTKSILENDNEHVVRIIDEAKILESENENKLRLMELEREERLEKEMAEEWKRKRRILIPCFLVSLILFGIYFTVFYVLENKETLGSELRRIIAFAGAGGVIVAFYAGLALLYGSSEYSAANRKRIIINREIELERIRNQNKIKNVTIFGNQ